MGDTPEGLCSAASQLFLRGEMRGLAILFCQRDVVAEEALYLFLDKHGDVLSDMVQGKNSELGVTFKLVTDSNASRAENTTPHLQAQKELASKIGRLLIYAGAYELMKNAVADVSAKTGKSERWIYDRWAEFNRANDLFIKEQLEMRLDFWTKFTEWEGRDHLTEEELQELGRRIDSRLRWKREYDTGKVTLDSLPPSVFRLK